MTFGRVVIDDRGISQKRFLLVFGKAFSLLWPEITAWAATDAVIVYPGTGEARIDSRVLELHADGKVHFVTRSGKDPEFQQIVDAVRHKLPEKERASVLTAVSALRQAKALGKDGHGGA